MAATGPDRPEQFDPGSGPFAGLRAMVIDDEPVAALDSGRRLERLGLTVAVVPGGPAALERVRDVHDTDLLVIDLHLPGVDGFTISRVALDAQRRAGVHRVVIVTAASVDPEEDRRCRAIGVDDVVPKPIDIASVTRVISRHPILDRVRRARRDPGDVGGGDGDGAGDQDSGAARLEALDPANAAKLVDLGILDDVVDRLESQLDELARGIRAPSGADRRRAVHTLAGSMRIIGAVALVAELVALEATVEADCDDDVLARLDVLVAAARGTVPLLRS